MNVKTHEERGVADRVTVVGVEEELALYLRYPQQHKPQPAFIRFDLRDGRLTAGRNPEIGGGVPESVWNGIVREYSIPPLRRDTVNDYLLELAGRFQEILDDPETRVYWDGSNWKGHAEDYYLSRSIEEGREWLPEDQVQVWPAEDYYADVTAKELGITAETTDDEIEAISKDIEVDVVEGAVEYLTRLRDDLREEG